MEFKHNLIFDSKKYELTVGYMRAMQVLPKIPQEIGSKLLKNEDYTVKSQVPLEVFQGFLDYWKDSKEPEINSNNLYEYNLLSEEFGLMKDYLTEHTNEDDFHLSSLKYLSNLYEKSPISDKSEHERYIAIHLDSFLEKREAEMLKIRINSLHNIFFHKERVLNDQQKAFDFINKNKNKNSNLLILLPSLDAGQLNSINVIDLISKAQENHGFIPNISQSLSNSYVYQLKEKNEAYHRVVNKLIGYFLFKPSQLSVDENELINSVLYEDFYDVNTRFSYENEIHNSTYDATPLYAAIQLNNIELVKYLLAKPEIDVNAKSISIGDRRFEEESFELLNGKKEKIKYEYSYSQHEESPLYFAIEEGNIEIIKLLLDCPQIDVNEKNIIEYDVYTLESAELSSSALKLLESITRSSETIIKSKENLKKTYKFVGKRIETNAFHYAIKKNNIEIIKLLLSHPKLDINYKSVSVKNYMEANFGSKKLCCGYDEYAEKSALHLAIKRPDIEIIKLLLATPKLDINIKSIRINSIGSFSLLAAGIFGSLKNTLPLLSSISKMKISFDKQIFEYVKEKYEKSALYYAIENGNIEIIKLLLSRKDIDINSKNHGESYFKLELSESEQSKIQKKAPKITEWINDAKNDLEPMKINETPLHLAVKKENTEIIEALLENKNINVKVTNEQGKMPIDLTNKKEIIALLNNPRH